MEHLVTRQVLCTLQEVDVIHKKIFFKGSYSRFKKSTGTWVAQSVKSPTPDFSSGHDLMVVRSGPALSAEPPWNSLSPSFSLFPSAPPMLMLSFSLSK